MRDNQSIAKAGKKTRFTKGHAPVGTQRGGRPRSALADLLNENAEFALGELRKIANAPEHEHWFEAVRELGKLCIPRRRELTGEAGEALATAVGLETWRTMLLAARSRFDVDDDKPSIH